MALVEYTQEGHIAIITINRPEKLNALNNEIFERLADYFAKYEQDDDAWVAILTSKGKAFSVGMDLKEALADGLNNLHQPKTITRDVFIEDEFQKPVIAAINGYAIGGGLYLAMKADFRVVSESAIFQLSEVQRGMVIGIQPAKHSVLHMNLPNAINAELLCGMKINAQRALKLGFVNKVVPEEQLLYEAIRMAEELISVPPLAPDFNLKLQRQLRRERKLMSTEIEKLAQKYADICYKSEDMKESSQAFLEKRQPVFQRR